MTKIIELRENRNLTSKNFSGYKLSLDRMPIFRQELSDAPFTAKLNDAQYSLLHVELFSLQNLLVSDPWARKLAFYVNESQEIIRSCYNGNYGRAETLQTVFRFVDENIDARTAGDYNYSMRFISEKYCILCDGIKTVFLFDTGDRLKATEWKTVVKTPIELPEQRRNFTIYDSRLDIVQDKKVVSLILGRIENANGCSMQLYWTKLHFEENNWTFDVVDIILGKGSIYYCAFEPHATSLIICSNQDYDFQSKIKANLKTATNENRKSKHGSTSRKINYDFIWEQTIEETIIKFPVIVGKNKSDYNVKNSDEKLFVKCGDRILMDNELYEKINLELTTWTVENNCLQITLNKKIPLIWHSLFPNDGGPEESNIAPNGFGATPKPIPNLEAPIEDCDFPLNSMDEEVSIDRLHLATKERTHRAIIRATPPLFSTNLRAGYPPALALRQDVDASLWLQQLSATNEHDWSLHHEGNLNAFGYVLASKTQKKFTDCAPDLNYAVICESKRHLFLYKAKCETGLRNRNGPPVDIGKQYLMTLDDVGEVLGLTTDNDVIVLLTDRCLIYLQII